MTWNQRRSRNVSGTLKMNESLVNRFRLRFTPRGKAVAHIFVRPTRVCLRKRVGKCPDVELSGD